MTRHCAAVAAMTICLALSAGTASAEDRGCAPGDVASAGIALFGAGTEPAGLDTVAGLRTALVLEPYIVPGTRHRLISIDGGWCDAETAFNQAWAANGRAVGDGRAMAAAYARLAAAPYYDQTSVTSRRSLGATHVLRTHARTNGVVATWTVVTDAAGVRDARWISTGYAVKPFEAQWEGLTAVDGVGERYSRVSGGRLSAEHGLPTPADLLGSAPGDELVYTGPDGFKVVIAINDTRRGVDPGADTGNDRADILRVIRAAIAENYQDFHDWGFRANWSAAKTRPLLYDSPVQIPAPEKTGYVAINNITSVSCQACVFYADDFQIHISSEVRAFLEAMGYQYGSASDRDVLSDVLGHEMFHNWQNNYYRPDSGRSLPGSFMEGTARFQQTLHRYSGIEHQRTSLLYDDEYLHTAGAFDNTCNGLAGDPPDGALAAGPFELPEYTACNFWLGWYGAEGLAALTRLVTTGMVYDTSKPGWTNASKVIAGIEAATAKPYTASAAAWATALITGKNLRWGNPVGPGAAYDWATYLERWTPGPLAVGGAATRTLADGGVMANRVTGGAFRPSVTTGAGLAVLRDSAAGTALSYPSPGEIVPGATADETVYVIATWPRAGSQSVRVTPSPSA